MLSSDLANVVDGLYFPRLFGSKITGYIYLTTLFFLIFYKRKKIIVNKNYSLLVLIFIFSYLIPFAYGLIKTPVLHDRYIIFVLIPVLLLISCLSNEIRSKKIKNFIVTSLIVLTLSNHYLEIFKRKNTKPEFTNMIAHLKVHSLEKNIVVTGDRVTNASTGFDENGQSQVNITLDMQGGRSMQRATGPNIGRGLAVLL